MFALIAVVIEVFVLLMNRVHYPDEFYDHRQNVMSRLNQEDLTSFVAISGGDPLLGWNLHGPQVYRERNCAGLEVESSYNAEGARIYPGYDEKSASIITLGDSFTHGTEAGDEEAYPAQLAKQLGASVANHGVGGFGPVQSFLNLKQKIHHYPQARTVVLGIMYENIYRMMNSYRPVYIENVQRVYALKPYMAGGYIHPHPGIEVLKDFDSFSEHAERAFDNDFWAKPDFHFPYSLSLLRALKSNYFRYVQFQKIGRKFGVPDFYLAFRSDDMLVELFALLDQYVEFAENEGLKSAVVFIPRNGNDTQSATKMIDANRNRFPMGLLVGDVGSTDIDWDKYNLVSVNNSSTCHPSAYGYKKIAEYVADMLKTDTRSP